MKNTILITGGSSGIGLQLAREFINRGDTVLACGRSLKKLEEAKKQLPSLEILACDISSAEECEKIFQWVAANFPSCNVLINNAAIVHATSFVEDDDSISQAEKEFQTNVLAPIRLIKLFLPLLRKNDQPKVINITTGLIYAPRAIYPFYNATKAALHSFTQVLRMQASKTPVRIIEVLMPVVDTPWHKGNPPRIAISPEVAVKEMLKKLEKNNTEIRVGKVSLLYWLSRVSPSLAIRMINSVR